MITDINLDKGLMNIFDGRVIFTETIIPSDCTKNPNSTYKPEYDWLFTYERIIAGVLDPWMSHLRFELIGDKGIICEALSNAFCHGHKKDPTKPIELNVYLGEKGLIIRIKDTGTGFEIDRVMDRYIKGKAYFHMAGNGLKRMIDSRDFHIFFTDNGTGFNLMYLFNQSRPFISSVKVVKPYKL
ncbi:ATP-binding protein [Desulforegula conservatrix]|uniref:ATP-binding protein n=1 Tax=Desulforegula conservatrix TaxID=153026 RepID=UPI0004044A5D|nr:ATP-binding protein [Desulforegula conservatrix]